MEARLTLLTIVILKNYCSKNLRGTGEDARARHRPRSGSPRTHGIPPLVRVIALHGVAMRIFRRAPAE